MKWPTTVGTNGTTSTPAAWSAPTTSPAAASWPRPSSRRSGTLIPPPSPASPTRGSYVAVYWVLDGYHDVWNRWALRQVNALHAAGRMFEERDHVHTLLYNYAWEYRRDPDGVPVELALDHPYRGFVPVFIDRAEGVTNEELWDWLRTEHLPGLLPGTDADLVAAFTPIALEVDAPGDVPREAASDNRTLLLWFLNTPPEVAWEPVIAEHRRRLEAVRQGHGGGRAAVHPHHRRAPTPTPTNSG